MPKGSGRGKGHVELPAGIQESTLKEAPPGTWARPKSLDEVEVHIVGAVAGEQDAGAADGETLPKEKVPFFSTRSGSDAQPLKFILGSGSAPAPGLDIAIKTMRKGQISQFTLSPEHAYGKVGGPTGEGFGVPPGVSVVFEVELLGWVTRDDLFGNGKIIKAIISEGSGFQKPKPGSEVRVSYKATRESDNIIITDIVDQEYMVGSGCAEPVSFALALERSLSLMKRGEISTLKCEAGAAFASSDGNVSVDIELHELCDVVDVSLKKDGSFLKKCIKRGEGPERPKDGERVKMHVESIISTPSCPPEIFSPQLPRSIEFVAGNGEVCDALELLVRNMQKHERVSLTCKHPVSCVDAGLTIDLGVSEQACKSAKALVYRVELVDFEKGPEGNALSEEEKVELASSRKAVGNNLFKQKRWLMAIECYKTVVKILDVAEGFRPESRAAAQEVKRSAELNKAACALQLGEWELAKAACDLVLKGEPRNVKALFRRGSACVGLNEFPTAISYLKRCLEEDPTNADAKRVLQQALRGQKAEDQQQKGVYSKMCEGLGKSELRTNGVENAGKESPAEASREAAPAASNTSAQTEKGPSPSDIMSADGKPIIPGMRVRITGLVSRTDLNGMDGKIVAWDTQERRWRVQLATGQGICVKPSNMLLDPKTLSGPVKYGPPPPPQK